MTEDHERRGEAFWMLVAVWVLWIASLMLWWRP